MSHLFLKTKESTFTEIRTAFLGLKLKATFEVSKTCIIIIIKNG